MDDRAQRFLTWLDRVHDVVTRMVAVGVVLLVGWGTWRLLSPAGRGPAEDVLKIIEANWKACLMLLAAMFYRPIRLFLENLEEVLGAKRRPHRIPGEQVASGESEPPSDESAAPPSTPES